MKAQTNIKEPISIYALPAEWRLAAQMHRDLGSYSYGNAMETCARILEKAIADQEVYEQAMMDRYVEPQQGEDCE